MEWGTVAGMFTALFTMITAIVGFTLRRRIDDTHRVARNVEHIVNQDRTDRLQYQKALIAALRAAGVAIPEDQSTLE